MEARQMIKKTRKYVHSENTTPKMIAAAPMIAVMMRWVRFEYLFNAVVTQSGICWPDIF